MAETRREHRYFLSDERRKIGWFIVPMKNEIDPVGIAGVNERLYQMLIDHPEVELRDAFGAERVFLIIDSESDCGKENLAHIPVTSASMKDPREKKVLFFNDELGGGPPYPPVYVVGIRDILMLE